MAYRGPPMFAITDHLKYLDLHTEQESNCLLDPLIAQTHCHTS